MIVGRWGRKGKKREKDMLLLPCKVPFLTKYIEVICNIKAYVDKGDDDKAKNIISKFVDEYFTSPERLAYKGDLDNTIKRLEEIDERRNENV